jgi:hypothetical protein
MDICHFEWLRYRGWGRKTERESVAKDKSGQFGMVNTSLDELLL